jgi:lipid A ethanolaminephosphotransferase
VKLGLLAAFLACDWQGIADRVLSLGMSPALAAYVSLYALLAAALVATAWIPRAPVRLGMAVLLAISAAALLGYQRTTGSPLDYAAFEAMVAATGDAGEAWAQHAGTLLGAVATAMLVAVGIALPPGPSRVARSPLLTLPLGALALLAIIFYLRDGDGEGGRGLPAPFPPLAHAAIYGALKAIEPDAPREAVRWPAPRRGPEGDIVLIVDESIAARYLDINDPGGVVSGLARSRPGLTVANFGVAAAATNCSAGSNAILRFGGTPDSFQRAIKVYPSIWSYARKAGLRTVYLDGQRAGGQLQNLMTPEEKAGIDDFEQFESVPVIERDHVLAERIAAHLANGRREFIFVNKIGAHFPVADKFPPERARYRPLPPRASGGTATDVRTVVGRTGSPGEWRLYRNAYRNTVAWNVGAFFNRLLPRMIRTPAVLLYTSDHGQDLHERGNPGQTTHCHADPLAEQGAVPLVIVDSATSPRFDWQAAARRNHDRMDHFRLFATVLALMGYDRRDIAGRYGPDAMVPADGPLRFTYTFSAGLGRAPSWRVIDPARLASPPAADAGGIIAGSRAAR